MNSFFRQHLRSIFIVGIISFCLVACNNQHPADSKKDEIVVKAKDTMIPIRKNDSIAATASTGLPVNTDSTAFKLITQHIVLQNGVELDLRIPEGYHISVAAEGLRRLRFLTKSPDGRLFATGMYDRSDNTKGSVLIFSNWNDSAYRFMKIDTFLHHLHNPNQVAFYTRNDSNFLYVAETGKLSYYPYHAGDSVAQGEPVVIARFPDYGLSYKYGGWHLTRSIAFHNNKLYVSVGSSCNACIEKEEVRATVQEMNPDGSGATVFASGLRNSVGIKFIGNQLWATSMGRDLIGPDKPEDLLLRVDKGVNYHWPYYYQYQRRIYPDAQMQDSAGRQGIPIPAEPPVAFTGFKAHSAPLGLEYFHDFADPQLNNAILVALHGSTSVWRERGNEIVKANGGNRYTPVVTGFLTGKTDNDRKGRPCDVLINNDHSFFFTDDLNGVLYYVWK